MSKQAQIFVGRRKNSVARVFLKPSHGEGFKVSINGRPIENYFPSEIQRDDVIRPMRLTNTLGSYDVTARVNGGGTSGQAGAVRLGIARALVSINEEFKPTLRKEEMMTRDPRMVERKKSGQPKARKRFQFSKR